MMGLEEIKRMNATIAAEAEAFEKQPMFYDPRRPSHINHMPNFGDYRPGGWRQVGDDLFIDKTGRGAADEPALTQAQFLEVLVREYEMGIDVDGKWEEGPFAYAIVEEGPFQVYIGRFVLA
jgi:hypothetical protein